MPPELRALTTWLRKSERLKTAGLFVNSTDAAMLWAMHQPADKAAADSNREPKGGCALAVKQIREALDRGQEVFAPPSPLPWPVSGAHCCHLCFGYLFSPYGATLNRSYVYSTVVFTGTGVHD